MIAQHATILRRVFVGALLLSLLNAFVAGPVNADHRIDYETEWFSGEYVGGASYMAPVPGSLPSNPTGITEPVAGVMVCGPGERVPVDEREPDDAGGGCPPVYVQEGDRLEMLLCDGDQDNFECRSLSFGVCIDGDEDGFCRPEHAEDTIYFNNCNEGGQGVSTTHVGPSGPLFIFSMYDPTRAEVFDDCTPTEGWYRGFVAHPIGVELHACQDGEDNDNNGLIDYPDDPGCDSPEDDLERRPECRDGVDNDGNGLVDYPDDPGCSSAEDWLERPAHIH